MANIECIARWKKGEDTYGDPNEYTIQSEKYCLEFLGQYLQLGESNARHIGGGNEPDGMLATNGKDFAAVEVRIHMENFQDLDQPNGSGWPQVSAAINDGSVITLDEGLGTWVLWIDPNAGALRKLMSISDLQEIVSEYVRASRCSDSDLLLPQEILSVVDVQEFFFLPSGIVDECLVIPRVSPFGGSFTTSSDHISAYMRQRISNWNTRMPGKRSYIEKWHERTLDKGVEEIHVVNIFENPKDWIRAGIMYQFMSRDCEYPSTLIDLSDLPSLDWNFWLLLRNPLNGDFHCAYRYHDNRWVSIFEE